MYILINLENHQDRVGDIVSDLVSKYGVPLCVTDNMEKLCPKCGPNATIPPIQMMVSSNFTPSNPSSSASSTCPNEGNGTPPPSKNEPTTSTTPPPLNLKISDCLPFFNESGEKSMSVEPNPTEPQSEGDSANGSIAGIDEDEDDSLQNPIYNFNPELLASFIANTPNMFTAATNALAFTRTEQPRTVKSGKERRGRIVYSPKELDILNRFYKEDPNACANPTKRKQLCELLKIDHMRLKIWFQNRRRRDRIRSLEEENPTVVQHHRLL